jgi:hypothetical protein
LKILLYTVLLLMVLCAALLTWFWPRYDYLPARAMEFELTRYPGNPIVDAVAEEWGYVNINGPSVIRVPGWIENPLGKYYLYFAHHKGSYIRLAYADHPLGPWQLHKPGALAIADSHFPVAYVKQAASQNPLLSLLRNYPVHIARDLFLLAYRAQVTDPATRKARGVTAAANVKAHIASPEVVVDEENRRLVMYFHGLMESGAQASRVALSDDGLAFRALEPTISTNYLRAFDWRGLHYLLGMPGILYRSASREGPFEIRSRGLFEPDMRHAGLHRQGSTLYVFWSRVGDAPESILLSTIDLGAPEWDDWQATEPVVVLQPKLPWEGSELPVLSSLRGELDVAMNELRDPFVFADADGQLYLFYVGAGERAIGVARLTRPTLPISPD